MNHRIFVVIAYVVLGFISSSYSAAQYNQQVQTPSLTALCNQHIDYITSSVNCTKDIAINSAYHLETKECAWVPAFKVQYHILPELIKKYNWKRGCEIGVLFGTQSLCILAYSDLEQLYCIDPFQEYPVDSLDWVASLSQTDHNILYELVVMRLAPYSSRTTFIREPSPYAAARIADGSLDFVYIDGSHQKSSVIADLEGWFSKIRSGGFIVGDDYCDGHLGVIEAVDEFVSCHKLILNLLGYRMYLIQKQ